VEAPLWRPIFAHADFGDPTPREPVAAEELPDQVPEALFAEWTEVVEADPLDVVAPAAEPLIETLEQAADDVLELVNVVVEAEPHPVPRNPSTIAQLMARLESGAGRRAVRRVNARPIASAPRPIAPAPRTVADFDGALRTALSELQRMAAR
jgi:hypothetical protein